MGRIFQMQTEQMHNAQLESLDSPLVFRNFAGRDPEAKGIPLQGLAFRSPMFGFVSAHKTLLRTVLTLRVCVMGQSAYFKNM